MSLLMSVWNFVLPKSSHVKTFSKVKHLVQTLVISYETKSIQYYVTSPHMLKGLDPNWGSKQHQEKRKIKLGVQYQALREDVDFQNIVKEIEPLKTVVREQGDKVRTLKASSASEDIIKNEVQILKARKKELENLMKKLVPTDTFDRARMLDLIKRRFFYDASFSIYGGIAGQYDYGPMGCEVVDNILAEWQRHFVIQERMLKINCSSLTPENVLKASGHVDKFTDYIVKDEKTGEYFRLDHLLKHHLEAVLSSDECSEDQKKDVSKKLARIDGMTMGELQDLIMEFDVKYPSSGCPVLEAAELNLMFPITIGPSGASKGFLRPETAQGVFVNFKKLLEYKQGKLPFACAQIGNAFRNETAPKSGLLRVREFTMAEIEHFCYPDDKTHPKFSQVSDTRLWLHSACDQMEGELPKLVTVGDAVEKGLVANETLGYYMARIQQFLLKIGIDHQKLRFRQHMSNEMAHYAQDCWDAECLTSYGWTECVGCADRSAYDLSQHSQASGISLSVERPLPSPITEQYLVPVLDKTKLKKRFGEDYRAVRSALEHADVEVMEESLQVHGSYTLKGGYKVTREEVKKTNLASRVVKNEKIIPSVIEPSFGIGRIFYALLEHSFRAREENNKRTFFAFDPLVAPVKASILPLIHKADFMPIVQQLADAMTDLNLSIWIDDTRGTIGRRYVRMDEMGVPFAITIDEDSLSQSNNPPSVTLRERDSTAQVRVPIEVVPVIVKKLSEKKLTWQNVVEKWPSYFSQET